MKTITIMALMLVLAPGALHGDQARLALGSDGAEPLAVPAGAEPLAAAPEAWSVQDPADSLYRAARETMNRGDYAAAADLFRRILERHPRSTYAPDALYWEAFNRYRTGDTDALRRALESLARQREQFPKAQTVASGDARALETRVQGLLARRGDEPSARAVAALSADLAEGAERIAARSSEVAARAAAVTAASTGRRSSGQDVPERCREEAEFQLAALNALIHMNADRALPVLKNVMARRDECSPLLRRRAVFLIADKESPETVDLLLTAAREDPDLEVQRQAVFWLSEVDDERAVDALQEFLNESRDEKIRERAVFALAQHDNPKAHAILRGVIQDAAMPTAIRKKSIYWLGEEGSAEDAEFLKGLLGELGDPELEEQVIVGVAQSGRPEDAAWLLSIAADGRSDSGLREKAIFWAAEAGAPASALTELYGRLDDRRLKERVLFGLSETEEGDGVAELIRIARTEEDLELRKKALFWLGNSNDPRAADVLLEIISTPPRDGGR